jgi:hypothetical protein
VDNSGRQAAKFEIFKKKACQTMQNLRWQLSK